MQDFKKQYSETTKYKFKTCSNCSKQDIKNWNQLLDLASWDLVHQMPTTNLEDTNMYYSFVYFLRAANCLFW